MNKTGAAKLVLGSVFWYPCAVVAVLLLRSSSTASSFPEGMGFAFLFLVWTASSALVVKLVLFDLLAWVAKKIKSVAFECINLASFIAEETETQMHDYAVALLGTQFRAIDLAIQMLLRGPCSAKIAVGALEGMLQSINQVHHDSINIQYQNTFRQQLKCIELSFDDAEALGVDSESIQQILKKDCSGAVDLDESYIRQETGRQLDEGMLLWVA